MIEDTRSRFILDLCFQFARNMHIICADDLDGIIVDDTEWSTAMKIDSLETKAVPYGKNHQRPAIPGNDGDFAKALKDASRLSGPEKRSLPPIPRANNLPPIMELAPGKQNAVFIGIEGALGDLDAYRHMLADTGLDMRTIESGITSLRDVKRELMPLLDALPEQDPLKPILHDTLTLISKEIERFENGYYIDS